MKYFMGPYVWDETLEDIEEHAQKQNVALERVDSIEEAEAFVFTGGAADAFPEEIPGNIAWIQHCFTGVEHLIEGGVMPPNDSAEAKQSARSGHARWANTAGAFAKPVAEMALGFILSAGHLHVEIARTKKFDERWEQDARQVWLYQNKKVLILGAGGIGTELIRMLAPFNCEITAVNRSGRAVEGAVTVPVSEAMDITQQTARQLWASHDIVVNILPLTPETEGMIGAGHFETMKETALFINVGRGRTVDTDALVEALRTKKIAGAGLEVMDPEPLPDEHPLWELDNCTITPHIGASHRVARFHVGELFVANAQAYLAGEQMPTEVVPGTGY